jgi:glycogen phosphorylase/synthase
MKENNLLRPDYLFEVSWEICNKVGAIHTIISTKVPEIQKKLKDNYILIGPDVWKETQDNPEITLDDSIFRLWREKAASQGMHFRIGRWNVPGNPIVILIDFTPYFSVKDKIFEELWLSHKVDSMSGQWDYIEPALFGHAAARVIESFYDYYITSQERIVAHFHEWMTGAGVLYIKEFVPQVGTVFTTHSTIIGRTIASGGLPLYKEMETYQGDAMARRFNILAKYSLEKTAGLGCDTFTTISSLSERECMHFLNRAPDLLTPAGYDTGLIPNADSFTAMRKRARNRLLEVASAIINSELPDDTFVFLTCGRYEVRNKGIDLFIDALGNLNKQGNLKKPIVAIIVLPANQAGPRREVVERIKTKDFTGTSTGKMITHTLFDREVDPVLKKLKENGLANKPEDMVKVVFAPCYLNGYDGIFDLTYHELLPGFDLTVYPSYYEPWGIASLESLANRVPTITTNLSGFGLHLQANFQDMKEAFTVLERSDDNGNEIPRLIAEKIISTATLDETALAGVRNAASEIASQSGWDRFIHGFTEANHLALTKVENRKHLFRDKIQSEIRLTQPAPPKKKHEWKKILIRSAIPKNLEALDAIARNLWWCWNNDAKALFESIDPVKWKTLHHNPLALFESLTYQRLQELSSDTDFLHHLALVSERFRTYMKETENKPARKIAYFSMEFGLHDSLKIFSGGLGVLAGDYLKEASDSNQNMIGIGLLYRYGYFQQNISILGDQVANLLPQKFTQMPIQPVRDDDGNWVTISLALPGRKMFAKVWVVNVGRIPLFLLDTDIPENQEIDKIVTHQLYGGDWENRFKQELLLGVGGIRVLHAMGIAPDIYHLNEGHAAFTGLERLRYHVLEEKLTFSQALELVRTTSLFTTHTPVPAGHDSFSEDLLRTYIPHYAERLNISWEEFMNLGRWVPDSPGEKFSMSVLAARLSQEMNGVSRIHGRVSREMFARMYEGYFPEELHIGHVTNGVHYPSWAAPQWQELYSKTFGENFTSDQSNPEHWKKIHDVPDQTIWEIRNTLRAEMIRYVKDRVQTDMRRRQENPKTIARILGSMNEHALTIGFARRFATYKRAHLLFADLERLKTLLNQPGKPVQLIFAGKAHPADKAGQELIKKIMEISKMPDFIGKVTFVENYDMDLASKLVQGVDVWLNTPMRPLEASGTSGEKAVMNGVVNFSVLDGWWAEGYLPEAGWALPEERTYTEQNLQDELDALSIYNILENEIIPVFYTRDITGLSKNWISYVKHTISGIAPHFTMKKMMDDYVKQYYTKLIERSDKMKADNYQLIRDMAAWKRRMMRDWNHIEVLKVEVPDSRNEPLNIGDVFRARVTLDLNGISSGDIGVEILFGQKENDEVKTIHFNKELRLVKSESKEVVFEVEFPSEKSGVFDYAFRIFPKHELLPHWQDLNMVTWF